MPAKCPKLKRRTFGATNISCYTVYGFASEFANQFGPVENQNAKLICSFTNEKLLTVGIAALFIWGQMLATPLAGALVTVAATV